MFCGELEVMLLLVIPSHSSIFHRESAATTDAAAYSIACQVHINYLGPAFRMDVGCQRGLVEIDY